MATAREIRSKIRTIKSTQKITRAMQMVAASKMRRAQDRLNTIRPYSQKVLDVISHLANAHPEYRHPFMQVRDIKRVGYIIVSTDRGLCGALNINLFRETLHALSEWKGQHVEQDLCLIGTKAEAFFRRFGGNILAKVHQFGESGHYKDLIGAVKVMVDAYEEKKIDALFIGSNEFVNTMVQRPRLQKLLPIASTAADWKAKVWDYIYEPDARTLLEGLLTRYLETLVYTSVVENFACEQVARMLSMKNATDNAGQVINGLQLVYNKARQAAITTEIAEIVGGAEAIQY